MEQIKDWPEIYGFKTPDVERLGQNEEYQPHHCMVCGNLTDNCPPSPFMPYSGWRCRPCVRSHRIPYEDLLVLLRREGATNYEEALESFRVWWRGSEGTGPDDGKEYAEKYWLPTLKFFDKTPQEAWEEANVYTKE